MHRQILFKTPIKNAIQLSTIVPMISGSLRGEQCYLNAEQVQAILRLVVAYGIQHHQHRKDS